MIAIPARQSTARPAYRHAPRPEAATETISSATCKACPYAAKPLTLAE